MLNKSRSSIHRDVISLNTFNTKSNSPFHFSLDINSFSLRPNSFLSLKSPFPTRFRPNQASILMYGLLNPLFSCISRIRPMFFGFLWNFWGFLKFLRFCDSFGLGVVYLMLYDYALYSISIFTMFHAFRCVFICWKSCAARFGLGWTHDEIFF